MMKYYPRVLTIAGSDSGGGAGIQADIKAISACGTYAMSAVTALTAQNSCQVEAIHIPPAEFVEQQIDAVLCDLGADAVKLGMLPTPEIIEAVARQLRAHRIEKVVLDPVMISTSGARLISDEAVEAIRHYLFPLATLLTPNIPEAEFLSGVKINSTEQFEKVSEVLKEQGVDAMLLKAGHLDSTTLTDYLYENSGVVSTYTFPRIETPNTHGTGCTLSSSIAAYLAQGDSLQRAVEQAEHYLHSAIEAGAEYKLGEGHGAVHHFFGLK